MIVIDHRPYLQLLHSIEPEYEYQLDEEEVMSFLFDNLNIEATALQRVEWSLQQQNLMSDVFSTTRLGLYRPACDLLHGVVREIAYQLLEELRALGCYHEGKLCYYPVKQSNKLESYRVSLQPLMLYNAHEMPIPHES